MRQRNPHGEVGAPSRTPTRRRRKPRPGPPGDGAAGAGDVTQAGASAGGGPGPGVVVATADPSLLRMLTFALDQMRLPHQSFTSGTVVLQWLRGRPRGGRPVVVVLDVDLPGVDGHAILERLGAERPDEFLIIVLSSHADESVQVRSLLAGALDHMAKPFNVRVLMAKLQRWVTIARHYEVTA